MNLNDYLLKVCNYYRAVCTNCPLYVNIEYEGRQCIEDIFMEEYRYIEAIEKRVD